MKSFTEFFNERYLIFESYGSLKNVLGDYIYDPQNIIYEDENEDENEDDINIENNKENPFLTNEEMEDLLKIYREDMNSAEGLKARDAVVYSLLGYRKGDYKKIKPGFIANLVNSFIKLHPTYAYKKDELMSDAEMELMEIITRKWDPNAVTPFIQYLKISINGILQNDINVIRKSSLDERDSNNGISVDETIKDGEFGSSGATKTYGEIIPDEKASATKNINSDELMQIINAAYNSLPELDEKIIKLSLEGDGKARNANGVLRGLTNEEIAAKLAQENIDIKVGTIQQKKQKAKEIVKKYCQEHGVELGNNF